VRDCEKALQIQRMELSDVTADLQDADRVLSELWEAALHSVKDTGDDSQGNDTESTSSRDSGQFTLSRVKEVY
jgi:hypothetical protein